LVQFCGKFGEKFVCYKAYGELKTHARQNSKLN